VKLYNSLTRKIEGFKPLKKGEVKIYTCGPTVYNYPTIGNWRTYLLSDFLIRGLKFTNPKLKVKHVMNLTDVGHLTGDNEGDADTGEDRLEKQAKKDKITAWDIAKKYGGDFCDSFKYLNIIKPDVLPKATEHIEEQVKMVQDIEEKGYTYKIDGDGIYFDTKKYLEEGNKLSALSTLDNITGGARVKMVQGKKDSRDFALWKFNKQNEKRDMEWQSPWGIGFPGWHIECSAMAKKHLGNTLDIHLGGEDLRSTHHPNEITQSECTNGVEFVKYWMHGAFIKVDGGKMGKSLGNAYSIHDIIAKGYDPLALRILYLQTHYRKPLNFTFESLKASQILLSRISDRISKYKLVKNVNFKSLNPDFRCSDKFIIESFTSKYGEGINLIKEKIENDLDYPSALVELLRMLHITDPLLINYPKYKHLMWEMFEKTEILELFGLETLLNTKEEFIPKEISDLAEKRKQAKQDKDFIKADELRAEVEKLGYKILDKKDNQFTIKKI